MGSPGRPYRWRCRALTSTYVVSSTTWNTTVVFLALNNHLDHLALRLDRGEIGAGRTMSQALEMLPNIRQLPNVIVQKRMSDHCETIRYQYRLADTVESSNDPFPSSCYDRFVGLTHKRSAFGRLCFS
jgi:hypothetical protein